MNQVEIEDILPVEEHVIPADRADVRQQRSINAVLFSGMLSEHPPDLPRLPVDEAGQDEGQTAGGTDLLLEIAGPDSPPLAVEDVSGQLMELLAIEQPALNTAPEGGI